jgi:hypothetical protein
LDLRGAFIANSASNLEIGHTGGAVAGVQGELKIATNILRNFTMNRAATTLQLGSPMLIQGGLSLARGVLRSDTTYRPIVVNATPSGILGGNDSSYVEGPLERYFPNNILAGGAGSWLFPVGRSGRYLPFSIVDPRTGGDAPLLRVAAFTGLPGGSVDGTLSQAGAGEYWNVSLRAGDHTFSRALLGRLAAIPANAVVAKAPVQSGVYTSIGGVVQGNQILSGTFASFSTFTIGAPFASVSPPTQPTIVGFGPIIGTSGTSVIVTGTNLANLTNVLVGGVPMSYRVISATQIEIRLDEFTQTGPITLQSSMNGSATSFQPFTFVGAPTTATLPGQMPSSLPVFSPLAAAVGQEITIRGNFFVPTPSADMGESPQPPVVRIGNVIASFVEVISPTEMRVRFPVATSGTVTLQAWGGISTTGTVLSILPPPQVRTVGPSPAAVGETVTVTGRDFTGITTMRIGETIITDYRIVNATTITFVVPRGATTSTISVRGTGGTTTSTTTLGIIPPPIIRSFTPNNGSAGQLITLTGDEFTGATAVRFGNTTATFSVSPDGRSIQAIVPGGVVTGATVSVTTRGGTAVSTQPFLGMLPPNPVITGFEPVPVPEGGILTVRGVGFPYNPNTTQATVFLGGVPVPGAYFTSSTTMVLRVPNGVVPFTVLSTNAILTLQTPRGSTSAALQVPILAADAPVITGFSPQEGDSLTTIRIEGRNFGTSPRTSVLDITIGGVPVSSFVILNSQIIISVAGPVASGPIVIRTPSGTVSTTGSFRYTGPMIGGVAPQDSLALLALYQTLGGPNWTESGQWGRGFVGSWYGVSVEQGRVAELRLPGNNVQGAFNQARVDSALAQMTGLRVLDLSGNGLTGALPRRIGSLRLLQTLNLSKNKLTGDLKELCGLQALRDLDIRQNGFRDSLQGVLCCLINLERAYLSENRLYGRVPLCLTDLQRLVVLDASVNELSDTLPAGLSVMQQLVTLNLRRNQLTGVLPAAWGDGDGSGTGGKVAQKGASRLAALSGLVTLDLGANRLVGSLPSTWLGLRGLRTLALDSNRFVGVVPEEWVLLGRLNTLLLGSNALTDAPNFSAIARLENLGLEDNAFEFGPLEYQSGMLTRTGQRLAYSPQAEVGTARTLTLPVDAPWTLRVAVSGQNNRYEWRKQEADGSWRAVAPRSVSSTLRFAVFRSEDAGVYRCFITNALLPALTLVSRPQVLNEVPSTQVPAVPILVEPEQGEAPTALRPVFVWTSSEGAARYDLQIARDADFRTIVQARSIPQSVVGLEEGVLEALPERKLERSTRYYWRVASANSFGRSAWATTASFTTAEKDIAFSARVVDFGRVPRLDTGFAVVRLRNVADSTAWLVGAEAVISTFAVASVGTSNGAGATGLLVAQGASVDVPVAFLPLAVQRHDVDLRLEYRYATRQGVERDSWTQARRLRGTGSALKLVAPALDTILLNLPRVSAALLINRGGVAAEVDMAQILGGRGDFSIKGARTFLLGAGDTTAIILRCEAKTTGAIPLATLKASGRLATNPPTADTAALVLRSFARRRQAGDLVARLGVRAASGADNLPPGTGVNMELYLNTRTSTSRDSLFGKSDPVLTGSVRYGNQVLSLSSEVTGWRRVRNTGLGNRLERVIMPRTPFAPVGGGEVLAQFPVRVVAGDTDRTTVEIEDIRWAGVYLIEYDTTTVTARLSQAGGKRLIGAAAASVAITSVAPNPVKEAMDIRYTLPENGFVEIALLDARGTIVQSLFQAVQSAGEHTLNAKIGWLASGSYTLQIRALGQMQTRLVQIVR